MQKPQTTPDKAEPPTFAPQHTLGGNYLGSRPQLNSGAWLEGWRLGRNLCSAWEAQGTGMFLIGKRPRGSASSCHRSMCRFSEPKSLCLIHQKGMPLWPKASGWHIILRHNCLLGQVYKAGTYVNMQMNRAGKCRSPCRCSTQIVEACQPTFLWKPVQFRA